MGEDLWRSQHAEPQLSPPSHPQSYYPAPLHHHDHNSSNHRRNESPTDADGPPVNGDEEPYTIKCICGIAEDDGNTVLCEQCNTWQHIDCYFPSLPVPDIHKCAECWPRPLDSAGAAQRQQQRLRDLQKEGEDRKPKRAAQKSHKKSKTKDLNNVVNHTNGWPLADGQALDRKSGSPRDQPPPAKRPKTSHKNSSSLSGGLNTRPSGHRHRSGSNLHAVSTVSKPLAECPPDYLSPDFINVHHNNTHFTEAQANLHVNIAITNLLSTWLDDTDAFAAATNGKTHDDVFKHFPQPIEELETPIRKNIYKDTSVRFHGSHPIWPYLTVDRDLMAGDFVGELRGQVGHRDDYKADPSNRWEKLRHPDHFVFFHPQLPIYIDCRSEGTLLRYVRRSCRPNLKLETIITGAREYRFCFTALTDLPRGTEITVSWDTQYDRQLQDCLTRTSSSPPMSDAQKAYVQDWVSTILAHFGGCACVRQPDSVCLMEHFDHRLGDSAHDSNARAAPKNSKKKKAVKKSPPSTGLATNSRAGSEVAQPDQDAEMDDNRSTSHSAKSPTSRDGSPNGPTSGDATGNGLSERDKKKLMQQERLFDKMEQDQHGGKKKKRSSGSNLNTPTLGTHMSNDRRTSLSNPNTPAPGSRPRMGDGGTSYFSPDTVQSPRNYSPPEHSPHKPPISRKESLKRSQPSKPPIYVEATTQTESDEDAGASKTCSTLQRKPYMSLSKRLLKRAYLQKVKTAANGLDNNAGSFGEIIGGAREHQRGQSGPQQNLTTNDEGNDVQMQDASLAPQLESNQTSPTEMSTQTPLSFSQHTEPSYRNPFKPPAPLWPRNEEDMDFSQQGRNNFRSTNLHVDLPPQTLASAASFISPTNTTPGGRGSSISPSLLAQEHPPSLQSSMSAPPNPMVKMGLPQPSPVKKKMSLSDYMNKRKTPNAEKSQSQSLLGGYSLSASEIASGKPENAIEESGQELSPVTSSLAMKEDEVKREEMSTDTTS